MGLCLQGGMLLYCFFPGRDAFAMLAGPPVFQPR